MKKRFKKSFTFEGKRYYVYGDTEREAIRNMVLKRDNLIHNRIIYDSNMKVSAWTQTALKTYRKASERYMKELQTRTEKHILTYIGNCSIGKVRQIQCQEILNNLDGYSKSYIYKVYQDLRFIFRKALENQMISTDPTIGLVPPAGHRQARRSITDKERKALLEVCSRSHDFDIFLLMLYCGCRPQEAINAEYRDIVIRDGIRSLHIRGTKSANSDRCVPLPLSFDARESFSPLCPRSDGQKHTESSYKALTRRLKREMNILMGCKVYRNQLQPPFPLAPDFVPYCLRHTYCTDLQTAGIDIRTAQKLMGHADISTTANIYTHHDSKSYLQAGNAINQNFSNNLQCGQKCGQNA